MKSIGAQAKEFRLSKGWNAAAMASEVQKYYPKGVVNRQKIEQLEEAGDRRPRYLVALAKAMGTTVEVLEAGTWANTDGVALSISDADDDLPAPTPLKPPSPGARYLVMQLGTQLKSLDSTDRKQAAAILHDLALDPDSVELMAAKLEKLLGEMPPLDLGERALR